MSSDEDNYGEIPDEDLYDVVSDASQTLPSLQRSSVSDQDEEGTIKPKRKKFKIHEGSKPVPEAQIIGATQAELSELDSSPYRFRGPIWKKPRPVETAAPLASIFTKQSNGPRYQAPLGKPPPKPSFGSTRSLPDTDVVTQEVENIPNKSSFTRIGSSLSISEASAQKEQNVSFRSGFVRTDSNLSTAEVVAQELDNIPDDFFSSPEEQAPSLGRPITIGSSPIQASFSRQRIVAPQNGLQQSTLFGGLALAEVTPSQARKVQNYRVDLPPEAPTHHRLNEETLDTWIYPSNLGETRNYQFSIVANGLFNNLLVALPTGLGKTFIAATIMFNFFRWTRDAQIVFVAPTKPLVAQQVDACFKIVGLPRSSTTMLTGEQAPAIRAEEWEQKRVFFMTPQTLINDLSSGIADPKKIVLLVVDEAHRATGEYAYNKVVQFIRRFNKSFRVLALTATPGATVEAVQEVIDGLEISKVEIRTEESIDIRPYTHKRNTDTILLDPSDEIIMVKELLSNALQPLVNLLCSQNAYWSKDPMAFTSFGLMQARVRWAKSDAGRKASGGLRGMVQALFSVLQSVAHCIKLLNFHGIGPFYESIKAFRESVEEGKGGSKYKTQIVQHADFKKMMDRIRSWVGNPDFVGHPKLTFLCDTILNHFLDAGDGKMGEDVPPSSTRAIVFSEYRDSAEDIARVLNRHGPLIRASVFVGQADSKRSQGMNQEKQQETIRQFRSGKFNVIVATSIGEEGLDIGSVDLIVCYDASASPIRMLQRMGRTGRKRAGNIVLLLMRGKEEEAFVKAKDNYEQMQKMISSGARFNFRHDLSVRILPKTVSPKVEHRLIDIPPENSQDLSLPVPTRGVSRAKKKPAKKFHMPDGVETGFQKASKVGKGGNLMQSGSAEEVIKKPDEVPESQLAPIPDINSVLLTPKDEQELEDRYQNVAGTDFQEVEMPSMIAHPVAQRSLLPTVAVPHGQQTQRAVNLFKLLSECQCYGDRDVRPYNEESGRDTRSWTAPSLVEEDESEREIVARPKKKHAAVKRKTPLKSSAQKRTHAKVNSSDSEPERVRPAKRQQVQKHAFSMSMEESNDEEEDERDISASSEGEGDDLARSEELSEDESEGESLLGFVVGSDAITNMPSSPPTLTQLSIGATNSNMFYETQVTATQDTNDDIPDIDILLSTKRPRQLSINSDSIDETTSEGYEECNDLVAGGRRQQRRIVEDDSDE